MTNLQTVESIYRAFGSGDVPAILSLISEDVRWEDWPANRAQAARVPYLQPQRGKAGVAAFFATMAGLDLHDFQVLGLFDGGHQVIANVEIEFTVKATGKRLRDEELHLWTFDSRGQVIGLRHYVDTAKHIEANTRAA